MGKPDRLKSRKIIDQLFREGKSFARFPYRVHYLVAPAPAPAKPAAIKKVQFGVAVSKKHFRKAVDRNRIKRLTREAYRLQKNPLLTRFNQTDRSLAIFMVYTDKEMPAYKDLFEKMNVILKRLMTLADEDIPGPS